MRDRARRRRGQGIVGAVSAVAGVLALGAAAGVAPVRADSSTHAAASGVVFFSIRVAPDYATSRAIFAAGVQLGCQSSCSRLYRSTDGGHTWQHAMAAGWSGGDAWPAQTSRGLVLLAPGPASMQESWDAGEHFSAVSLPAGSVDVTSAGGPRAIVVDGNDRWHVAGLADLSVHDVPGASGTLADGTGHFVGPAVASGGVAGLASGKSVASGHPAVARCTASWQCDAPADIAMSSDNMLVQPSPDFSHDTTVFARSLQRGGIFRSTDGGHSFSAVMVAPAGQGGGGSATVEGLAFSADFDAAATRGIAYAAAGGVDQSTAVGQSVGGVYMSRDGGALWRHFGPASELDHGATAVAATPDGRVVAAFLDAAGRNAGLLCAVDESAWQADCPGSAQSGGGALAARGGGSGSSAARASAGAGSGAGRSSPSAGVGGGTAGGSGRGPVQLNAVVGRSTGGGRRGLVIGLVVAIFAVMAAAGAAAYGRVRRRRESQAE